MALACAHQIFIFIAIYVVCILNFGPGHAFWLFGCERLNGVWGSFPTNHCKIELQMIRNFSVTQHILRASNSIDQDVQEILKTSLVSKGTLHKQMNERYDSQDKLYVLLSVVKEEYLCSISLQKIDVAMKEIYGEKYQKTGIIYKYSKALKLNHYLVGAKNSIHYSSSLVLVRKGNLKLSAV